MIHDISPVAVPHYGVELGAVLDTGVLGEHCPGRAVAPATVNLHTRGSCIIYSIYGTWYLNNIYNFFVFGHNKQYRQTFNNLSPAPEVLLSSLLAAVLTLLDMTFVTLSDIQDIIGGGTLP